MNAKQLMVMVTAYASAQETYSEARDKAAAALKDLGVDVVKALRKGVKIGDAKKRMAWSQAFLTLARHAFGPGFSIKKIAARKGVSESKRKSDAIATLSLTLTRLARLNCTKATVLKAVNKIKWSKAAK